MRKRLEDSGLKLRRDVVAGMSKGGWAGFYLGAEVPDGPDAIAIFAAGKDPRYKAAPPMPKTLSVLVGTGETDPNYPQAQLAVGYFRQGGASVSYEEWLGHGHTYMASPKVVDWLHVESLKDRTAELSAYALIWAPGSEAPCLNQVTHSLPKSGEVGRIVFPSHLLASPDTQSSIPLAKGNLYASLLLPWRPLSSNPSRRNSTPS